MSIRQALSDLNARLDSLTIRLARHSGIQQSLELRQERLEDSISEAQARIELLDRTSELLKLLIRGNEASLRSYIEPVVTEALQFVFEQPLYFHLVVAEKRNQIEVEFLVLRNDEEEQQYQEFILHPNDYKDQFEDLVRSTKNLNYNYGGAINQVLSLILRLVIVELLHIKGPIVLDEPSGFVHETYNSKLGKLISSLSERFNRQYIIITHSSALASASEKQYNVTLVDGVSKIQEIDNE